MALMGRGILAIRNDIAPSGDTVSTLASPACVERLNDPTPWTRGSLALFRNTKRTACRVSETLGIGIGGVLATFELGPVPGRDEQLPAWLPSAEHLTRHGASDDTSLAVHGLVYRLAR